MQIPSPDVLDSAVQAEFLQGRTHQSAAVEQANTLSTGRAKRQGRTGYATVPEWFSLHAKCLFAASCRLSGRRSTLKLTLKLGKVYTH